MIHSGLINNSSGSSNKVTLENSIIGPNISSPSKLNRYFIINLKYEDPFCAEHFAASREVGNCE